MPGNWHISSTALIVFASLSASDIGVFRQEPQFPGFFDKKISFHLALDLRHRRPIAMPRALAGIANGSNTRTPAEAEAQPTKARRAFIYKATIQTDRDLSPLRTTPAKSQIAPEIGIQGSMKLNVLIPASWQRNAKGNIRIVAIKPVSPSAAKATKSNSLCGGTTRPNSFIMLWVPTHTP